MLKKLALRSRPAPSRRFHRPFNPNRFTMLRSMERYFGPRKTLRPIPGGFARYVGVPALLQSGGLVGSGYTLTTKMLLCLRHVPGSVTIGPISGNKPVKRLAFEL